MKNSSQIEEKECSVCLKIPEIGDILHKLPCSHMFHKNCIVQWLQKVRNDILIQKELKELKERRERKKRN